VGRGRSSTEAGGGGDARYAASGVTGLHWARSQRARVAGVALAVCALTLALGAVAAKASLLSASGSFGSPGSGNGQFQSPQGVAIQQASGNVYVIDSGNARVEKFSAGGSFIAAFGQGRLSFPRGIATDNSGKVYVGDAGTNTVLKFDSDGNFVATIDGTAAPQGHFQSIAGIAVDQAGNLWVADSSTSNVIEFDSKGKFVQQWHDSHGSPNAIAVDSARNAVYLTTFSITERWTLTGNYQSQVEQPVFFGSEGFNGPNASALAVDRGTGNLYIDHNGVRADVTVYDPTGIKLDDLSLGQNTDSQGLAFASLQGGAGKPGQGRLYLSDASNNNVTIYAPRSTPGAPLITAESVDQSGKTTATLHAGIVPLGSATSCHFEYVATPTSRPAALITRRMSPARPPAWARALPTGRRAPASAG
jgi:DNA-binding beta-propeller fold protein YncE